MVEVSSLESRVVVQDTGEITSEEYLRPSVFDRLLDDDPKVKEEPVWQQTVVLESIRENVRRDIQDLLNSRHSLDNLPKHFQELDVSLLNYGLPDLQSLEVRKGRPAQQIAHLVEEAIRNFEPRLQGVRVRPHAVNKDTTNNERKLTFEIEAVLVVEPLKEPVLFTSSFNSTRNEFSVKGV